MNLSMSDVSAGYLLSDKTLQKFCNHQIVTSITLASYKDWTSNTLEWHPLSIMNWSFLIVKFTLEIQVCLGMLWSTSKRIRFLKWQSLLLQHHYHYCSHKLSFLNVSWKRSSLLNFATKSPKIIYVLYLWNSVNSYSNSNKMCFEFNTFILSWRMQILYNTPVTPVSIYDILSLTNSAHFTVDNHFLY